MPSFVNMDVLDPNHLVQLNAMKVPGKGSLFDELVAIFRREAPPRLEALSIAVASRDAEKTAKLAHAMVGSLSTLGARQMQHAMRCLESAAPQGDWPFIENLHKEVLESWKRLLKALESR
jgi:HPt (histidine-containing phosphotransfer) domain-containing protein